MTAAKEVIAAALEPLAFEEWHPIGECADYDDVRSRCADAILAALDAAGLVVVPREPTKTTEKDIDDAMLALALSAVGVWMNRSSFVQTAEWAHDEAGKESKP